MSKNRAFCFIINNPTDDESIDNLEFLGASLAVVLEQTSSIKRFCFQFERGESGTLHIQGYCGFDTPSRFSRLHAIDPLFVAGHCEAAHGSPADNLAYCTKDEGRVAGPWCNGDFNNTGGQRNELLAANEIIQSGGSMKQLLDEVPTAFFKFHRGFGVAIDLVASDCDRPDTCEIVIFYGDPGTGKSFTAESILKELGTYYEVPAPQGQLWLEGYAGQTYILWDECYFNVSLHLFLQLLDRKVLPKKGGSANLRGVKTIIITTMKDIFTEIWPNVAEREKQGFFRRLTAVYQFTGSFPNTTITCKKYSPWSHAHKFNNVVPIALPFGASAIHVGNQRTESDEFNDLVYNWTTNESNYTVREEDWDLSE